MLVYTALSAEGEMKKTGGQVNVGTLEGRAVTVRLAVQQEEYARTISKVHRVLWMVMGRTDRRGRTMKLTFPNAKQNDGWTILLFLSKEPGHDWASVKVKGTVAQWLEQWKALGCFVYIIPQNRQ